MSVTYSPQMQATCNAGNMRKDDFKKVLLRTAHGILYGQEWSDQDDLMDVAQALGFDWIRPEGPAGATPLFFHKTRFDLIDPIVDLVFPSQYVGNGPGPDHNKDKFHVGAVLFDRQTRRKQRNICQHLLAGQDDSPQRKAGALKMIRETNDNYGNSKIPMFSGADWNRNAERNPLFDSGKWTCDSLESKQDHPTHGKNFEPDYIAWLARQKSITRKPLVKYVRSFTVNTGSDHDTKFVEFQILNRTRGRA